METDPWTRLSRDALFTTKDLGPAGLNDRDLRRALGRGLVRRVTRGVYTTAPRPDPALPKSADAEHALRAAALVRRLGPHVAASHHSALALRGLPLYGADLRLVHLGRTTAKGANRQGAGTS